MGRTLAGLGAMAAIFIGILGLNDAVGMFFDILSLVFVVGLTFAGTVASFPSNRLLEALVPGRATTPEAMARRALCCIVATCLSPLALQEPSSVC